jgi:hypothetical protein
VCIFLELKAWQMPCDTNDKMRVADPGSSNVFTEAERMRPLFFLPSAIKQ